MIRLNDVEQMVYLFSINTNTSKVGDITSFEFSEFGVEVIFLGGSTTLSGTEGDNRFVYIKPDDILQDKKMEVFWELMKSGYMHYLRIEYPRTFKDLIINRGWDRKIIEKRLELYNDKPRYQYLIQINKDALRESASYILSIDPGFFDFLNYE
jgi:hypothetical protein